MGLTNNNDIALKVGFDVDRLQAELAKTNSMMSNWGKNIQGQLLKTFSVTTGFFILNEGISAAVRSLAQFEKSMSEVKAITGATGAEFQALRNNALNLAGAFNALDISKLETEFGRLGFSTKEILASTTATINLASATGSDLATSAVIAGSTLRAFNLNAKEMGHVTDVMAGALNRTGLDMSNFAESIKYVAPNAYAANISLEETSALLGVLADNGIKGSMAGTTLRRILQDLSKDGRPLVERLQELADRGLNVTDAMDEVGRIGSTGLLVLTKNIDRIKDLADSLHNVTGEARAMSNIMQDNLIGDWNRLKAEMERVVQQGSFLNDVFRGLIGAGTEFLRIIQNPWTFFETPVNDAVKLWDSLFNTPKLKEFNDEARNSAKIFKSITDQLNAVAGGPLTPTQMGGTASVAAKAAAAYDGQKASGPKTDKVVSDPTAGMFFNGQYQGALKNIMEDAGYASEAFKQMWQEIDLTNDGLTLMGEEAEPAVTQSTNGLISAFNAAEEHARKFEISQKRIVNIIRSSVVSAFSALGQAIGNVGNKGFNFGATLLQGVGQMAIQLGELAIGIGIGIESIKNAFKSLNGIAAIAAGVALVALGSYFTSQASAIGSGGSGSSSPAAATRLVDSRQPVQVNLNGTLTAKGSDLQLVLSKQNYNNGRVGG